ncbi:MAG: hypothetical protein RLY49_438 [Candidatus Parcubacteria bacterium]|jgi:hypothetical protein
MLIDKDGVRLFNDYDLSATLNSQTEKIKKIITTDLEAKPPSNQEDYALEQIEKFRIKPLEFDKNNLMVDVRESMIPAEYFPTSNFMIREGESYPKDIYTFILPFAGDSSLLRCVPSTRILRTEEVAIQSDKIIFDIINFYKDGEIVKKNRDEIIKFIEDQSANVNRQVNQYNEALPAIVFAVIEQILGKISERTKLLESLGTPVKNNEQSNEKEKTLPETKVITKKEQEFDVFISYASEDREFVEKLANEIKNSDIEVWYDGFEIGWGDDLRTSIDFGLNKTKYGIVIFSPDFLKKKKWTEYELNGLFSKEKNGEKVVLPVWHNISREEILQYSPTFADRIALNSNSTETIVQQLKDKLK